MSDALLAEDAVATGIWCVPHVKGDPGELKALGAPMWVSSESNPETFMLFVEISRAGHDLGVSGTHTGPAAGDDDWTHRGSAQHWTPWWTVSPVDVESNPEDIADDPEIAALLSVENWNAVGSWLLGTALAMRFLQVDPSPEELSDALASQWPYFLVGFAH